MRVKLQPAVADDAESIAALRNAVADDLTFRHGRGPWTAYATTAAVLLDLRNSRLHVALHRGEVIASLVLATRRPWAVAAPSATQAERPLYLCALAVAPECQRQGIGRACLEAAVGIARRAKADAVHLCAFAHAAGNGEFFRRTGWREIDCVSVHGAPCLCFERLV